MPDFGDKLDELLGKYAVHVEDRLGNRILAGYKLSPEGDPDKPPCATVHALLGENSIEIEIETEGKRSPLHNFNRSRWVKSNDQGQTDTE